MKQPLTLVLVMLLALAGTACAPKGEYHGIPLVEVAGQCLYAEDLSRVQPPALSPADSTHFAEQYIRNWVEDALLYQHANHNVSRSQEIDQLVEQYRRSLVMHSYQQQLIDQKLAAEISDEDIAQFYEANQRLFMIDNPLIKGLFIKVPLGQAGINNVRKWYRLNTITAIENLEKFSLKGAVEYLYFYDHWVDVADMIDRIPFEMADPMAYLKYNHTIELHDTRFVYFLYIDEYLDRGQVKPLDYAHNEIKEILINQKQVEFMRRIKSDMYDRASRKNEIKYHYNASNQETNG